MARRSRISVGALNIVTHPHSPEIYTKLFLDAFRVGKKTNRAIRLRGDQYGMVLSCFPVDEKNPENGIEGEIVRFMEISKDEPWFNVARAEEATKEELGEIQIPHNLRPKMKRLRYFFAPKKHRFVFINSIKNQSISPQMAKRLVEDFLNQPSIMEKYPSAAVTVEQSREVLEQIFAIPNLRKLKVSLKKPNADDGDLTERAIMKELDEQNIGAVDSEYKADEKQKGIMPGKRIILLSKLAASNGFVEAEGRDAEGKKIAFNTEDKPLLQEFKERVDKINIVEWLRVKSHEVIEKLIRHD
jgi:hypothetical protein